MNGFKVGDRVVIINKDEVGENFYLPGNKGTVIDLASEGKNLYVKFDKGQIGVCENNDSTWMVKDYSCKKIEDESLPPQQDQWDESVRGKKMSSSEGKVIYKYQMPVLEKFTMKLPKGAEIIRMADQGGMFWVWCIVDTRLPDEERHFYAVKCGGNVPDKPGLIYHGFCAIHVQQELGLYIFEDTLPNED